MRRILVIDPSVKALGWAVFKDVKRATPRALIDSGVFRVKEKWPRNHDLMIARLSTLMNEFRCRLMLIEQPSHYGRGKGKAARNSGSILKLMGFVMCARQLFGAEETILVPVRKWKGQVKKEITQKRVKRAWGWEGTDHNEADAVGIGDWYLRKGGRLKV